MDRKEVNAKEKRELENNPIPKPIKAKLILWDSSQLSAKPESQEMPPINAIIDKTIWK